MNLPLRFLFRSIALEVIISSVSRKRKSQWCERALPKEIKVNLRFLVPWGKSRNAQKVCAVTIVGSVLKTSEDIALQSGEILLTFVWWWWGAQTCPPTSPSIQVATDFGPCQKLKKSLWRVSCHPLHLPGAPNDCFLWNICSQKQILPRHFCYLSTAKNF